jgi:hypothetical protein
MYFFYGTGGVAPTDYILLKWKVTKILDKKYKRQQQEEIKLSYGLKP